MLGTDFALGTQVKPTIVHITFDETGAVNHVGIGYEVYLPSAVADPGPTLPIAASAITWTPPAAHATRLSAVMQALLDALTGHAGLPVNHALGRPRAGTPAVPAAPGAGP
jgi:L-alanine-DL-glutamate epimerase-like enolase superfamily enzyme